jgi:ABC-type sugar transport system ATPase subunit
VAQDGGPGRREQGGMSERGIALRTAGLAKLYPPANLALRGVDFALQRGEIRGLLGANGAGKSTLIKLLCGVERPTEGTIWIEGRGEVRFDSPVDAHAAGIGVVHQELPLLPNLTAAENVVLGIQGGGFLGPRRRRAVEAAYRAVAAEFPGAPPADAVLAEVGLQGWQLTALVRARHAGARILILDEPTSTLSPGERQILHANLRRFAADGSAILYVSHFLDDILEACHAVTVLRDGATVLSRPTSGLSEADLLAAMIGAAPPAEAASAPAARTGRGDGLAIRGLASGGAGPLDLDAGLGERVGLYGLEGSGCAELLEAVFGLRRHSGTVAWRGRPVTGDPRRRIDAGLALVSGDRGRTMIGEWSVAMNQSLPGLGALSPVARLRPGAELQAADGAIRRLAIKGEAAQPLRTLSGGNQQKVAMARWLDRSDCCLLANEPTRGVDVRGRAAIHRALIDFCAAGNTLLVRSTDPEELVELCQRVIVMVDGRPAGELSGARLTGEALEASTRWKGRGPRLVGATA